MSLGIQCCSYSVVTIHGAYIVSSSVEYVVLLHSVLSEVCVQCPIWLFSVVP